MGLFSKNLATADVSFAGIQAYAESGDEDVSIVASVTVEQRGQLDGKESLPMLGSLGAVTLMSMLRREPQYVVPFMVLVSSMSEELMDGAGEVGDFSSRECVVTDPEMLSVMGGASSGFGGFSGNSMVTAALNSSLPVLEDVLPGPVERTTQVILKQGRNGIGYVRFKFGMGSANALTTIGAWTASVDRLTRSASREQVATPIGAGLKALDAIWQDAGYPNGFTVSESAEVSYLVADVTASHTPDRPPRPAS